VRAFKTPEGQLLAGLYNSASVSAIVLAQFYDDMAMS
jgi:hypothetical protein